MCLIIRALATASYSYPGCILERDLPYKVRGFPHSSTGKEYTYMQETLVQFLSQEGLLEKGMATHSSVLAGRIPWTEEPGGRGVLVHGVAESDMTEQLTHTF